MMTLEEMITKCEKFVENKEYYWFRLSYSNLSGRPTWVVRIETLAGTKVQVANVDLKIALEIVIETYINEVERALEAGRERNDAKI